MSKIKKPTSYPSQNHHQTSMHHHGYIYEVVCHFICAIVCVHIALCMCCSLQKHKSMYVRMSVFVELAISVYLSVSVFMTMSLFVTISVPVLMSV